MAKFFGAIGYGHTVRENGVSREEITELLYFGDVLVEARRFSEGEDTVNTDLNLQNTIEVVADAYAYENMHAIRYVKWSGVFWRVDSLTVRRPRLVLRLGGVYNGPKPAPVTP
jgi:hypothetical protein